MSNLQFKNGQFKIMSLGDLHEKAHLTTYNHKKRREDMHSLVEMGIKAFSPDLIVLMGDNCCDVGGIETEEEYIEILKDILKPVLKSGIPFAYILGNHEHDAKREQFIIDAFSKIPGCIAYNDEKSADFLSYNYLVKNTAGTEDILNLWFIDSNNLCEDKSISHYDWVHEDQIKWYEDKVTEIKNAHGGKVIPAVLFQHIPVYEEYELLREAKVTELPYAAKGFGCFSDKYYVLKDGVDGYLGEGPCSPEVDGGQFKSWKKMGDVKAAFFGHDHLNDFTGKVDGILLGQNKTSGFWAFTDGCHSLVRITTIKEENPEEIQSRVYHYKELGLTCHCLGPFMSRLTDRESMNMHRVGDTLGVIGVATATAVGIKKAVKAIKK